MLERYLGQDRQTPIGWDELGHGAPTIIALARLAAVHLPTSDDDSVDKLLDQGELSDEARALLCVAQDRGVFAIRGSNQAFESIGRFLMVHVETEPDQLLRFGSKDSPLQTIRFLEGFAQLCHHGLVVHHLFHEFSLSSKGFALAARIDEAAISHLIRLGVPLHEADW